MKVAVAHGPGKNVQELRKLLHGVGAQCATEDCVLWNELAVRLGRSEVDLIVVQAGEALDWSSINQAKAFSSAPLIAIGPNGDVEAAARNAGVTEYVPEQGVHDGLNQALNRMIGNGAIRCKRGSIITVIAPTAGNGGTFVSTNLAAHLGNYVEGQNAFVDVSTGYTKIGLMLHAEPENSLEDVCSRLHRVDRMSLLSYFHKDETGLKLLYGEADKSSETFLNSEVVRKLTVLTRMSAASTVYYVGSTLRQPQIDVTRMSDRIVMVVRPDVPSLKRAAMTMDKLGQYGVTPDRLTMIINFWGESGLASKAHIEETLNWQAPNYLTYDPGRVNRCTNEGRLLIQRYPRCRVSRQLAKLAQTLATPSQSKSI